MVIKHCTRRNVSLGFILALGLLTCGLTGLQGQDFLNKSFVAPGDAKPILLNADHVATWTEGGIRVWLLKGRAKIEQGLVNLSFAEGTIWVDEERQKRTGIYSLEIFGEGPVVLVEGTAQSIKPQGWFEMATRGEIRIRAFGSQVLEQALVQEPMYLRAKGVRQSIKGAQGNTGLVPAVGSGSANPLAPAFVPPPPVPGVNPPPPLPGITGVSPPPPLSNTKPAAVPPTSKAPVVPSSTAPSPAPPPLPPLLPESIGTPTKPGLPPNPFVPNPVNPPIQEGVKQSTNWQNPDSGLAVTPAFDTSGNPPGSVIPAQAPQINPVPPVAGPGPPVPAPTGPAVGPPPTKGPPTGPPRNLSIRPRSPSQELQFRSFPNPTTGETAYVVTSGVILAVGDPKDKVGLVDIEADRLVFWTKGDGNQAFDAMRGPQGQTSNAFEFFLSGNVEIRNQTSKETQVLRAEEAYYDVGRNVAVAVRGDVEISQKRLPHPMHLKGEELLMLGPKLYQARQAEIFSTVLPSDPGLKIMVTEGTIEDRDIKRRNIFGRTFIDAKTGEETKETERIFTGKNMTIRLEGVPVFYFPYIQGDANDPLGPLQNLAFNYNRIFGFQAMATWNMFDLLGITPLPNARWRLMTDYMSARGPALGSVYDFSGKDPFGLGGKYDGVIKAYGMHDTGKDIIGGNRGQEIFITPTLAVPVTHPDWRGRFLAKTNVQDLMGGFTVQGQVSLLSDKNFLEQFFNQEFYNDLNQETFIYVKQQQENWAWTILAEPRLRDWVTETEWFPKLDGYVLGQRLFDLLSWNLHASAGYAQLKPTNEPSFAYLPTDVRVNTGRFDIWNELSLPFSLGDLKVMPYVVGDLAYYTEDVNGDSRGRVYGGAGVRTSLPFSRLFPDVHSELFNLDGIFHKITFTGNYFYAYSDTSLNLLPQLDRWNDDESDQALRDIRPRQPTFNPNNAYFLTTSNLFNPQYYALRRLIDNHVDTLDSIDVFQLGLRQRWQTKRGFPGNEHIIDWMTLDLRGSLFPQPNRDNFGSVVGILEYDWLWNIGDRTSLLSTGWFEPEGGGPRVVTIGANINRPDKTSFYLGYRHIDPLLSRAIIASVTFPFSAKYALTASTMYDLGIANNNINSFTITRLGTDLQLSLSVNYNALLNTFGVQFEIMPNLLPLVRGGGNNPNSMMSSRGRTGM